MAMDQRLAKALIHPLRALALSILSEEATSPNRIAKKLDANVSNVAYHVKVLKELGFIELVETRQRRGAIEHFYRATEPAPKGRR